MPSPCPGCNKLCSLENADPEVNDLEINDGVITASVRLARTSACCSEEMKEYTYEMELGITADIEAHEDKYHKAQDAEGNESTEAQEYEVDEDGCDVDESGGSRYAKNMISVTLNCTVMCMGEHEKDPAGQDVVGSYTLTDSINAGSFDELV
jgi:hypothetical protein